MKTTCIAVILIILILLSGCKHQQEPERQVVTVEKVGMSKIISVKSSTILVAAFFVYRCLSTSCWIKSALLIFILYLTLYYKSDKDFWTSALISPFSSKYWDICSSAFRSLYTRTISADSQPTIS